MLSRWELNLGNLETFEQTGASGLAKNEVGADGGRSLDAVLTRLEELKHTPIGTVIYDQISRILGEYETVQAKVDHAYGFLLHVLLDNYASNPSLGHVTELNAKLIQARLLSESKPEAIPREPLRAGKHKQVPAFPKTSGDRNYIIKQSLERLRQTAAPAEDGEEKAQPAADSATPKSQTPVHEIESPAGDSIESERRVNSAYRLHLDRKRDEIEKLQRLLARNVVDTVNQNREFGAMLEIELEALQHAENAPEIETLRQILMGGIEELIQGQRSLDTKLKKTSDYLKIVESDTQGLRDELNKVRLLSLTDEFTGLANRRAFIRRLQDEIGRAQRYGTHLSLALIDLDEFKAINDLHGHTGGDRVLRCFANEVLSIVRHYDLAARYGGEEFAVLLPNTRKEGAVAAITKVKNRALEVRCDYEGKVLSLPTFSTGVTVYCSGDTQDSLIARADRALYRAKRLGRNRIEVEVSEVRTDPSSERINSGES